MEDEKVSIITPLYNAEEFIAETARSVFAQTHENFEWIIVNDASTDDSESVLRELEGQDERVRLISLEKNSGPIHARNRGLDTAAGRYIAFLDSDDLWMPEKLEKQLEAMRRNEAALSCTGYKKITREGELRTGITIMPPEQASYKKILHSDSIMASSAVYDRNLTGDIRQSCDVPVGRDDYHFFLQILKKHGYVYGVQEDLARLRVYGDSITGNKLRAAKMQWRFYREILGLSFFSSAEKFAVYSLKGLLKYLC